MRQKAAWIKDDRGLMAYLEKEIPRRFSKGDRVLLKLHMGEPGNRHYIKSEFTADVIRLLKEAGCEPFVFDTPVTYDSPRGSVGGYIKAAADHGYTEELIGAPVVISDKSERVGGEKMEYLAASHPLEADGVFLLSHFKGHICCGVGGSIKNVGMGCMSKETKGAIHEGGKPDYLGGCTLCGACAENCPTSNIRYDEDRPWFDASWCSGCSNCVLSCEEGALAPRLEAFDELLAEAAVLAHKKFKKTFAMNVMKGMTKLCDCVADSGPVLAEDSGYVCADDMLSADIASLEIMRRQTGAEDLFGESNLVSSWRHVRAAARLMERDLEIDIETI